MDHARLQALPSFRGLERHELDALFGIAERLAVKAGTFVVRAGDPADAFFMVVDGRLEVRAMEMAVATISPGHLVGEMPLIHPDPVRRADVVAVSDARLFRFPYDRYHRLAGQDPDLARKFRSNLGRVVASRDWTTQASARPAADVPGASAPPPTLSQKLVIPKATGISPERQDRLARLARHPVFSGLSEQERADLESVGRVVPITEGLELFRAGEPATSFLFVLEGQLEISVVQQGKPFPLARLGRDQVVGETALLQQKPVRSATVTATEPSKALVFPLDELERLSAAQPAIVKRLRSNLGRVAASRAWSMS